MNLRPLLEALSGTDPEAVESFCADFVSGMTLPDIVGLFHNPALCKISGFIAGKISEGGHPEIFDNTDMAIKYAALSFMAGAAFQRRIEELRQLERMSG